MNTILPPAPAPPGTWGIVLCAGGSTRMGRPKGLLERDGTPLIVLHVRSFAALGLPVRVVLGAEEERHRVVLPATVQILVNPSWKETGPSESAALALAGVARALLTPVDVPPARPETLRALLAGEGDAVPAWRGQDGHPVRLDAPHPPGRLDHRLVGARRVPVEDPDCVLNLNTPRDWEAWLRARAPSATSA